MKTLEVTLTLAGKRAHETLIILAHSVSNVGEKTWITPADSGSSKTLLREGAEVVDNIYGIQTSIVTFRQLPERTYEKKNNNQGVAFRENSPE